MNTLIVFNHPYAGSYCNAILESAQSALSDSGQSCDLIHLDNDRFNPVMSADDLAAFAKAHKLGAEALKGLDAQILSYAKKLQHTEHLVLIFPIWWELMPAMMKGFIDKLIFPAIAYEYTDAGAIKLALTKLQKVTIITTMNTPKSVYRVTFGNAIQRALVKGTFEMIGCKSVKWINLDRVKFVSHEKRQKWLSEIKRYFIEL